MFLIDGIYIYVCIDTLILIKCKDYHRPDRLHDPDREYMCRRGWSSEVFYVLDNTDAESVEQHLGDQKLSSDMCA